MPRKAGILKGAKIRVLFGLLRAWLDVTTRNDGTSEEILVQSRLFDTKFAEEVRPGNRAFDQ